MADKTISQRQPFKVSSLPPAPDIYDEFEMPGEYQGGAVKINGWQIKNYALAAVKPKVEAAERSAENAAGSATAAKTSEDNAVKSAQDAADSAGRAKEVISHAPVIREDRWWIWDAEKQNYTDTGVSAVGNVMYATFWIDPKTGDLYMFTPEKYTGPGFRLKDGNLEVVLSHG